MVSISCFNIVKIKASHDVYFSAVTTELCASLESPFGNFRSVSVVLYCPEENNVAHKINRQYKFLWYAKIR